MSCPPVDQLVRAELDELAVIDLRTLEQHERGCDHCRNTRSHLRELLLDLATPDRGGASSDQFVSTVLARCTTAPADTAARRQRPWRWVAAPLGLAAAVALTRIAFVSPTREDTWAARGAGRAEPRLDAQVFAVHGDTFVPVQGATMSDGDGLAVRYWNPTNETYYLMAFATDAEGTMHWVYPRYANAASDPSSVAIAPSADGRLLDEVVEPESPAQGPLQVTVLISERPLSVKLLEQRSRAGRLTDTSDLGAVAIRTWSSTWRGK